MPGVAPRASGFSPMARRCSLNDRAWQASGWRRPVNLTAFSDWLSSASLFTVASILLLSFGAALYAGWRLGRKTRRERQENDPLLTSAVLGLLALLLSFTYALAVDRYETRRLLVQEEANAIGTMYLRAQLIEEPHRSRISRILIEYTENRIALAYARRDENSDLLARNERLLADFWSESAAVYPSLHNLEFSSLFYGSANELIELDATRKSARLVRVPPVIFVLLFVYITATATLLGVFSSSRRALAQSCLFLALLVSFLLVIIDIDQPTMGAIRESQAPMERLRATLPD
jgi:hypothetical protein